MKFDIPRTYRRVATLALCAALGLAVPWGVGYGAEETGNEAARFRENYGQGVDGIDVKLEITGPAASKKAHVARGWGKQLLPKEALHHIVVTLVDRQSGQQITDARVIVDVVNPLGRHQRKDVSSFAPGHIEYSGFFRFDERGKYLIHVFILPKNRVTHLKVTFERPFPEGHSYP